MTEVTRITFVKSDILLWPQHNRWMSKDLLSEGVVMVLPSGREVAFTPTRDERALRPDSNSEGYSEWLNMPKGTLVEAEIL